MSELSLELLLLQVILPALLEQGHTRVWLKLLVRHWCAAVSHVLGLRSYLLGDVALDTQVGWVFCWMKYSYTFSMVQSKIYVFCCVVIYIYIYFFFLSQKLVKCCEALNF